MLTNDNEDSRRVIESCYKRHKTTVNPIIDWTDRDVWDFIHGESIPYCELYNEGFKRLGCIGCPLAARKQRESELSRWTKYRDAYLFAFGKMLEERQKRGKMEGTWRMGTRPIDVYNWWLEYDILPGQFELWDDDLEIERSTDARL